MAAAFAGRRPNERVGTRLAATTSGPRCAPARGRAASRPPVPRWRAAARERCHPPRAADGGAPRGSEETPRARGVRATPDTGRGRVSRTRPPRRRASPRFRTDLSRAPSRRVPGVRAPRVSRSPDDPPLSPMRRRPAWTRPWTWTRRTTARATAAGPSAPSRTSWWARPDPWRTSRGGPRATSTPSRTTTSCTRATSARPRRPRRRRRRRLVVLRRGRRSRQSSWALAPSSARGTGDAAATWATDDDVETFPPLSDLDRIGVGALVAGVGLVGRGQTRTRRRRRRRRRRTAPLDVVALGGSRRAPSRRDRMRRDALPPRPGQRMVRRYFDIVRG